MAKQVHVNHLRYRTRARMRHAPRFDAWISGEEARLDGTVNTLKASKVLTLGATAANTETVVVGGKTYTFKTALTEAKATGTLTTDNTNAVDTSTVVIGTVTYTIQTTLTAGTALAVHVKRGADADATLLNLARAINNSGGSAGVDYDTTGTGAHPTVTSSTSVTAHAITLTAILIGTQGNISTVGSTSPDSHIDAAGALMTGGLDSVANEIKVVGSASLSIDSLVAAINAGSGAGTDYSTATAVNANVIAAKLSASTMSATAIIAGTAGNAIAITETLANGTSKWAGDAVFLSGGADLGETSVFAQLRDHTSRVISEATDYDVL